MSQKSHFIAINSSPRSESNSTLLLHEICRGISEKGGSFEEISLHDIKLNPCRACDSCLRSKNQQCIQKDGMNAIYPKLLSATGFVISSPIYWFTYSAQLKMFIDRLYALDFNSGMPFKGKTAVVVFCYGAEDVYDSGAINAIRSFQDMFRFMEMKWWDFVYGSATDPGQIHQKPDLLSKAYKLGKKLCMI